MAAAAMHLAPSGVIQQKPGSLPRFVSSFACVSSTVPMRASCFNLDPARTSHTYRPCLPFLFTFLVWRTFWPFFLAPIRPFFLYRSHACLRRWKNHFQRRLQIPSLPGSLFQRSSSSLLSPTPFLSPHSLRRCHYKRTHK